MIPAAFAYKRAARSTRPRSLLAQGGADAKILAGGHSLIPLMRLRLAEPSTLVDINGLERELGYVRRDNGTLRIGAMTRHYQIEESADVKSSLPLLAEMAAEVGDAQVRSMGTIGGVLAHADPAGDYGTLALMLDATIITNKRSIAARDFFKGLFTTPLAADEIITEIAFPERRRPAQVHKIPTSHVRLGNRRRRRPEDGRRRLAGRHYQRGADAGPRQRRRAGARVGRVASRSRHPSQPGARSGQRSARQRGVQDAPGAGPDRTSNRRSFMK